MIVTETLSDGRIHTYSDGGFRIMQETGAIYDDAIDTVPHTYTETDELIPPEEEPVPPEEDEDYATAGRIMMGVQPWR